jgi:hypothetical protein
VIGTDGRQLLLQKGFAFPWKEDLLIPAAPVFGCAELPRDAPASVGRTDTHVCVGVGPWTLHLALDKDSRFPQVERAVPPLAGVVTTCRLSPDDARFLVKALPRLPVQGDEHEPVTVDLNGQPVVRARGEGQERSTELVLSRSEVTGPPVRFVTNRLYLARAAQLGFPTLEITKPTVPIVGRDQRRTYVWVPLDPKTALSPSADAVRICSDGKEAADPLPQSDRRLPLVTKPPNHGNGAPPGPAPARASAPTREETTPSGIGIGALIAEAQALKEALRDGYERANRLHAALKRHGKQTEMLRSALTSLRQLQGLGG